VPYGAEPKRNVDKPDCDNDREVRAKVFYRCTVGDCPLRHVQEAYCVACAQSAEGGHQHDHVYMRADDEYLVKYRRDRERITSAFDNDYVSIGGDSLDMMSLASELDAVTYQRQLISEGRGDEVRLTTK
jgi:hypothetical protein